MELKYTLEIIKVYFFNINSTLQFDSSHYAWLQTNELELWKCLLLNFAPEWKISEKTKITEMLFRQPERYVINLITLYTIFACKQENFNIELGNEFQKKERKYGKNNSVFAMYKRKLYGT